MHDTKETWLHWELGKNEQNRAFFPSKSPKGSGCFPSIHGIFVGLFMAISIRL